MDRRKELKRAYKQTVHPMGVYQLRNRVNGKILLGSSMNLNATANSYHFKLDFKGLHCPALGEDLKQYGREAFTFEILETIDPKKVPEAEWRDAVAALEKKWLDKLQPYGERGYHKQPPTSLNQH